jgi:hypothetical protein
MKRLTPIVMVASVLGLWASGTATVRRVPSEYPTIQAGIDAAVGGDTVLVADGTYAGDGNRDIDFGGRAIVLVSEHGPQMTIIDCEGTDQDPHRGFYFHSNEVSTSVVQGFTIMNGWRYSGGAILCDDSSPTILDNIMTGNIAEGGGAIMCRGNSYAVIVGNTITENSVSLCGGGIYCYSGSPASIENNLIAGNTAAYCGGGIRCNESSPAITGNTLVGNTAAYGGGICALESSFPTVLNSILWENGANIGEEVFDDVTSSITVTYSDVEGGKEGEGNVDADPLFASGPLGGYYLSQIAAGQAEESPCVDAGDAGSAVREGTTRTDHVHDVWPVDMGYHYVEGGGAGGDDHREASHLTQNYPNPFAATTTIGYSLGTRTQITLVIYDIQGARVRELVDGTYPAGPHLLTWDGCDGRGYKVASGIYLCRLEAGGHSETKRMVLLR